MIHFSRRFAVLVAALLLSVALVPLQAQSTTAAVTITVTSSANPSVFATSVTFTITVAAPTSAGPAPTGTVSATLPGPILLGSAKLDATGKAAITVPAGPSIFQIAPWSLPAGENDITFSYSGDAQYKTAQSKFTQWVNKADTTTTASIAGNAQPLHLVAKVSIDEPSVVTGDFSLPGNFSSTAPSGTVQFFNGTTLLGTAKLLPSGLFTSTATLAVATVPASLTAVYGGDDNYNGSTSATVVGTGKGTVNLAVTSGVNPSTFAEPVTFTIAVTQAAAGGPTPSGTVTASLLGLFNLGSAILDGTGKGSLTVPSLSAATASIPWGLAAGSDSITFSYGGDASYSSANTTLTQTVDKAATTTAATVSGSATSITATVSISEPSVSSIPFALPGANAAVSNPTGAVQFLSGSSVIGTAQLSPNGHFQSSATFTANQPLSSSSADLTAVYQGDSNYTGSTSPPATVPTLGAVTVGVTSSVNPATFAEPVKFSIKVAPVGPGSAIPTGTVQASVAGANLLGGATLDSTGSASITVPSQFPTASPVPPWGLATGSNVITVTYSDSSFAAGQSTFNQLVNLADTTTTVALDPVPTPTNTAIYLVTVSINEASVSQTGFRIPAGGNLSTSPTGRVDLFDGTSLLGSITLIPSSALFQSSATFTVTPIPGSVRAVYYGDTNYNGSSSQTTSTGNGAVNFTLASSANPTTYGAAFTVLATVTPATSGGPTPTGTVTFFDGSQSLNWTATLDSNGRGTLPIPAPLATPQVCLFTCPPAANVMVLGAGSHVITVQYSGDANYAAATSPNSVTQRITQAPTTTAVSEFTAVTGIPSESGITATVADAQPPSGGPYHFMVMSGSGLADGNPTGTVQFFASNPLTALIQLLGTASLTPDTSANVTSIASLSTTTGPSQNISATYSGDANFQGSSSPTLPATTVRLTSNPNPSTTGQSVTLTATVTSTTTTPALTGKVTFLDGTTPLGSAPVSGGAATLTTTFTTAGAHSLTANYSGDANYQASSSAAYTQTVNASTSPTDTLKLTVSAATAVFGQHIVLLAQVAGNVSTPPTGTVNFLDGTTTIGSAALSQSSAYLVVTLAVGAHQISAAWAGDANWPAAQSAAVTVTVNQAATVTRLTSFGTVWTAVVMPAPPGEGTPAGSVQFIDTVTQAVLATVTLSDGTASATLSSVTDPLEAVYSGDTNFQGSTSRSSSKRPPHIGR
jgi:hypothetical protein